MKHTLTQHDWNIMSRTSSAQSRIIAAKVARNANLVRNDMERDARARQNRPRVDLSKRPLTGIDAHPELRVWHRAGLDETLRALQVRTNYNRLRG